ncbi:type 1 glutamine amidotransferase [Burkholderia contaminans]|uniref:type 1 glutamine amidotransferase domain-containing protein n=1 Tax=Burkholderia contaminans TaxID=488447 RepID=UPI000F597721|nr:type 1 glutamine amidotransferase domain-containing protein [Burkholderia contaminans]RQT07395.1 type 1 glutamine amidotransferase [Burkholderia contaminans]
MSGRLVHCKVAILAVDGFEEAELVEPQRALAAEGAQVDVISQKGGEIQGFRHVDKGKRVKVDRTFDDAREGDYDAVVLPGGVVNGDAIRMVPAAREFVTAAVGAGKPIAAICHGGWLLVSSGLVAGRTMTSWPSLQDDIRHAGGKWVDQEVVRDGPFITSRKPEDLPAFNGALIDSLAPQRA